MKKYFIIILISFNVLLFGKELPRQLMEKKLHLMAYDLQSHHIQRLIHYFDPKHLLENIKISDEKSFQFTDQEIENVIIQWGILYFDYKKKMKSIYEIQKVMSYQIKKDKVEFTLLLKNQNIIKIYAFIDWKTLYLLGASG